MCADDKAKFLKEIKKVQDTVDKMSEPIQWTEYSEFTDDFKGQLDQYKEDVDTLAAKDGTINAGEQVVAKAWL
jgi:hypothetical protein